MTLIILTAITLCLLLAILFLLLFRGNKDAGLSQQQARIAELNVSLSKIESNLKEDFRINREENAGIAKDNRVELNNTLKDLKSELATTLKNITEQNQQALKEINNTLSQSLRDFTLDQRARSEELKLEQKDLTAKTVDQLEKITSKVETKLNQLNEQAKADNNQLRDSLTTNFKQFQETFEKNVQSFNDLQKEKFTQMEAKQNELVRGTETKLDLIRSTVEEKLEKTLSDRLGQSFETVGKQLIEVQKGLGEMQTIASDVGGLKKVLSNVKLRGGVGEVQLALLLEQMLAPNQYEANVRTKKGSSDSVEFAIKLPGRSEDENAIVFLPIDAKFPKDSYELLIAAYESAVPEEIEAATKNLETVIRKMAKDIRDKYIDPPNTTDFAILFLPFESIYAEVIRRTALVDRLRDEHRITVAGPTTLMAILNSLQMGFRTLALQKRSSEVWNVLAAVKKEFDTFGGLLERAQKNIQTGLGQLDDVVGTRTRAIKRKLNQVESLPAMDQSPIVPDLLDTGAEE